MNQYSLSAQGSKGFLEEDSSEGPMTRGHRRGEVKTAASGKGAISKPADLPGPFLPKGNSVCWLISLRGFPQPHPAPTESEGGQEERKPRKGNALRGSAFRELLLNIQASSLFLSSLMTLNHNCRR